MEVLLPIQKKILDVFRKSSLKENFYWTGGTLLAELYLHHRRSSDLDFFTDKPFDYNQIIKFIRILRKKFNLKYVEEKKIFDRREFFLHNKEKIRIEFVLYEYPPLRRRKKRKGIFVDSLDDIVANKTMAFFDRNDPKDLCDLYFILKTKKYTPKKILNLVEKKFGVRFGESSFWSEAYKSFEDLESLKPFLIEKNRGKVIKEIKEYFIKGANQYLKKKLG